jgi:hypothetical protein
MATLETPAEPSAPAQSFASRTSSSRAAESRYAEVTSVTFCSERGRPVGGSVAAASTTAMHALRTRESGHIASNHCRAARDRFSRTDCGNARGLVASPAIRATRSNASTASRPAPIGSRPANVAIAGNLNDGMPTANGESARLSTEPICHSARHAQEPERLSPI